MRKIRIRIESFFVGKRTKNFGDELYPRLLLVRHLFDQLHDFGFHFFHRSRSNVDERYEEFEFDAIVEVGEKMAGVAKHVGRQERGDVARAPRVVGAELVVEPQERVRLANGRHCIGSLAHGKRL